MAGKHLEKNVLCNLKKKKHKLKQQWVGIFHLSNQQRWKKNEIIHDGADGSK